MKNHARWYIAMALCAALVIAGCGAGSSAGPLANETPTVSLTPEVTAPGTTPETSPLESPTAAETPPAGETPTAMTAETPAVTDTPAAMATAAATDTTAAVATTAATDTPAAVATAAATDTPAAGTTPTVAGTPSVTSGGLQAVSTALQDLSTAKAFRMTTTITDTTGQATKYVAEFVTPGSIHITTPTDEFIVVQNSGAWQKSQGGQWQKVDQVPAMATNLLALVDPNQINQFVQSIDPNTVQSAGTDTLNGKAMQVYQFSTSGQANTMMLSGQTKAWIGQDDGMLYQSQTIGTAGATVFGLTVSSQVTVNSVFEYDSSITIQPPM